MKALNPLLSSLFFLILSSLITVANAEDLPVEIDIKLDILQQKHNRNDAVIVQTTFTNTSNKPIKILKWNTPLEGKFYAEIFTVKHENGKPIAYLGKLVKRHPATEDDFVTLKAKQSIVASLDLSKAYALSNVGRYTAQYRVNNKSDNKATSQQVASFEINEKRKLKPLQKQANFTSCSSSRVSVLNNVMPQAVNIANNAVNALNTTAVENRPAATRYTTWFGSYTIDRYQTATTHFDSIKDALDNQQINLHCDCNESHIAHVFPNNPYNIHLCSSFWNLGITGTDSQAGTIVHELSHFIAVADTNDHVYGQSSARNLALTNPINALNNADNHEYFAENTPFLAMTGGTEPPEVEVDSFEPDDNQETATLLTAGTPQEHSIVAGDDIDYVKIIITDSANITLTTSGSSGDSILTLYNVNGEEIETNDDSGSGLFSQIIRTLTPATYYAKVNSYNSSIISTYSITLTLGEPDSADQYESDNSLATAGLITPSSSQLHSIIPSGDEDWLKIIVSQTSSLTLTTSGESGNDTVLTLYDNDSEQIDSDDDGGDGLYSKIEYSPITPGIYYARIKGYSSNTISSYNVILTLHQIILDSDSDGMPDSWEISHGLNPNNPADAQLDRDDDGVNNLDEYLANGAIQGVIPVIMQLLL
ncbi:MAG: M35 family metallo-endopeptidase [Cocleimonas sp.]